VNDTVVERNFLAAEGIVAIIRGEDPAKVNVPGARTQGGQAQDKEEPLLGAVGAIGKHHQQAQETAEGQGMRELENLLNHACIGIEQPKPDWQLDNNLTSEKEMRNFRGINRNLVWISNTIAGERNLLRSVLQTSADDPDREYRMREILGYLEGQEQNLATARHAILGMIAENTLPQFEAYFDWHSKCAHNICFHLKNLLRRIEDDRELKRRQEEELQRRQLEEERQWHQPASPVQQRDNVLSRRPRATVDQPGALYGAVGQPTGGYPPNANQNASLTIDQITLQALLQSMMMMAQAAQAMLESQQKSFLKPAFKRRSINSRATAMGIIRNIVQLKCKSNAILAFHDKVRTNLLRIRRVDRSFNNGIFEFAILAVLQEKIPNKLRMLWDKEVRIAERGVDMEKFNIMLTLEDFLKFLEINQDMV